MHPVLLNLASLALAATATPSIPTDWAGVSVENWTADGSAILWHTSSGEESIDPLEFDVLTDPDARPFRIFAASEVRLSHASPEARRLWKLGGGYDEGHAALKQWITEHPLANSSEIEGGAEPRETPGGREPLKLSILPDGKACPTLTLFAEWGAISGPAAELRCTASEQKSRMPYFHTTYHAIWSPDGTRLALEWYVIRFTRKPAGDHYIHPGGGTGEPWDDNCRMLVISRRSLASIDLLDAGTARRIDSLAGKLEKAGFRLAHQGKAKDRHPSTEVFYAPGFESEAQEVAKLAGAAEVNVKPLSWKSPYAITVALGAKK